MGEHPARVRRRLVPDDAQTQIILGSLLGGALIEGAPRERRMRIAHARSRERYVWWKYERLVPLSEDAPRATTARIEFATIPHPLFDDLATLIAAPRGRARLMRELLGPLGLAVWMSDAGRFELRAELFLPRQRALVLSA